MNGVFGAQNSIFHSSIWHYGNPFGEQKEALESGAYCIDHSLGFLSITGKDRLTFLNTLSTQLLLSQMPGQAQQTLLLDTHGRIEHHLWVYASEHEIILITAGSRLHQLYQYLHKMIFWSEVQIEIRHDLLGIHLLGNANLCHIPKSMAQYWAQFLKIPCKTHIISVQELASVEHILKTANFHPAGMWAYEAFRIASLIPRISLDADDKTLPHELELINTVEQNKAVHLNKGCYRGQETVAKIYNLGKAPRRLVLLHFDEHPDHDLESGTSIRVDGTIIGRLGSIIQHYELGTIGLGLIKRSIPVDTQLTIDAHHIAIDPEFYQEELVMPPGKAAILEFHGKK